MAEKRLAKTPATWVVTSGWMSWDAKASRCAHCTSIARLQEREGGGIHARQVGLAVAVDLSVEEWIFQEPPVSCACPYVVDDVQLLEVGEGKAWEVDEVWGQRLLVNAPQGLIGNATVDILATDFRRWVFGVEDDLGPDGLADVAKQRDFARIGDLMRVVPVVLGPAGPAAIGGADLVDVHDLRADLTLDPRVCLAQVLAPARLIRAFVVRLILLDELWRAVGCCIAQPLAWAPAR